MKFKKKRYISFAAAVLSLTAMTSCGTVVQKLDSPAVNTGIAQKGSTVSTTAVTVENTETTAVTETTETTTKNNVSSVKVMRGNLYDADGDLLMFSQLDESGIKKVAYFCFRVAKCLIPNATFLLRKYQSFSIGLRT